MAENKIEVFSLGVRSVGLEKRVKFTANKALVFLNKLNRGLEVYLLDSKRMKEVNERFRGKNTPTNVLSFEAVPLKIFFRVNENNRARFRDLGEVYLCPSYIARNKESLDKLLIHGILHLLHYQHDKKNDTIEMEKLEEKIFRKLGLD